MIKRLAACIREYKRPTILTPVCMVGEVVCECTIPLLTADLINAIQNGCTMQIIEAVERVNERQKSVVFEKLQAALGDLRGKLVTIWGLAFKPETDDMREAPATVVIDLLLEAGAEVCAYDPVAMPESQRRMAGRPIRYARTMYEAAEGADAVALITEWKEFRMPDWPQLHAAMRGDAIIDGRNIFDKPEVAAAGFRYFGIGK